MMTPSTRLFLVSAIAITTAAHAQSAAPADGAGAPQPAPGNQLPEPSATVSLSFQHNLASDFTDTPGDVAVTRAGAEAAFTYATSQRGRFTVGLGAERSLYSFDNATGFVSGSAEPWDDIMTAQASARFSRQHDEHWSYFAGLDITTSGQDNAEFSDTLTYGGVAGVMYNESDRLSYGFAVGVHTRLEDDATGIPLPLVRWTINDQWTLATAPRPGGGQVALSYQALEELTLTLGVGFESRDFRLAPDAASPNGVGRDSRMPISFAADWRVHPQVHVTAEVGANLSQEFTLDDVDGNRINKLDADMGFFAGVGVRVEF